MAALPERDPQFNFEPNTPLFFDHNRVADEVLVPLINSILPVSVENGAVSNMAGIKIRGVHNGVDADISVQAYNVAFDDEFEEFSSVIGLEVEELVTDERRDMIIVLASAQGSKFEKRDPDDLEFRLGSAYAFNAMGYAEVEKCQTITNRGGEIIWTSSLGKLTSSADTNDEFIIRGDADTPILKEDDMDRIEAGIYIFKAPHAIKRALEIIRAEPVTY